MGIGGLVYRWQRVHAVATVVGHRLLCGDWPHQVGSAASDLQQLDEPSMRLHELAAELAAGLSAAGSTRARGG